MLNINFKVNSDILASVMISRNHMPDNFANYLWDKYRESYRELQKKGYSKQINQEIIKELQEQTFYKAEYVKAKKNCNRIKKLWDINKTTINNFLDSILKLPFNLETTAYIVSPSLDCGKNIGDNSFIWGHTQGINDGNYDLVYIVHESLHSFFIKSTLTHAIIENISDIELSKFLNNSTFGYEYHNFTQEEHLKIYPYWNLYLNKTKDEILKDQKNTRINYDIDRIESERQTLANSNIHQFIQYLDSKSNSTHYRTSYEIFFD